MRGAAVLVLTAMLVLVSRAQDLARWQRVDALLPPPLRDTLPALIRLVGDICELPPTSLFSSGELIVVEHSASGQRRYPASRAEERLREVFPTHVALYAAGWGNKPGDEAARAVVSALLTDHPLVLELDTSSDAAVGYTEAASRVGELAHGLTRLILAAERAGVARDRIHVVGFSLGAHAAGAAARAARRAGGGALGRLTALDPARPCFARGAIAQRWRLSRDDARFVQVIHSSGGTLGLGRQLGHVDVYLRNKGGGSWGRGAAAMTLAHHAAWRVWARSAHTKLRARRCAGTDALHAGACVGAPVPVGYSCSTDTRGLFLLET